MILYINCCIRDNSRTDRLARAALRTLGGKYHELYLPDENLQPLSRETLDKRSRLIENKDYSDPMFVYAKQFASADTIVISAPYWDLSFPSLLKLYIENIYVNGIVSEYDENGMPRGLCRAKKLIYVATAGGPYVPDFSYDYISALAKDFFGIGETQLIKAEMLDIEGMDAEAILAEAISALGASE